MGDFASVFDEAGDSAERAQADRAMAVAKQASADLQQFLFMASDETDFGHRIALQEDGLLKAAAAGGVPVDALVAEHRKDFGLLMEAKRTTAPEPKAAESVAKTAQWVSCHDCHGTGKASGSHLSGRPFTVTCPTCNGDGQTQDTSEMTSAERYGDTKWDDFYGKDPGDQADDFYRDATKHVASLKTALEEGQDPLAWLEQAGGQGQAEKPSEAGIEASPDAAPEEATRPF